VLHQLVPVIVGYELCGARGPVCTQQCVAVCYSVLQIVRCSVFQCVVVCCSAL